MLVCGRFGIHQNMVKHNKEIWKKKLPDSKIRKIKQVGEDLWNQLDLVPGVYNVVQ